MHQWETQFDEIALSKGKKLQREGKVEQIKQDEKIISGEIPGQKRYAVTITMKNGIPGRMKCHCPKYVGGSKCEHMAALLYAVYGIEEDEQKREEAKKKAEQEAVQRRIEEDERQKIREEAQRRIEARAAEKAAKRAERKRKRKEAEEAVRLAAEEAARQREEEIRKEQEERERKQKEEAERKQAELLEREKAEAERQEKKERKIREAIARASQREKEEEPVSRKNEDWNQETYNYYDMKTIRSELDLPKEDMKKGKQLAAAGKISIDDIRRGYINNDPSPVAEVRATGHAMNQEFSMYLLISRDEVLRRQCDCPECRKKPYWYFGEGKCAYMAGLVEMVDDYLNQNSIGDATDRVASSLLYAVHGRHENQVISEQQTREKSLNLVPRLNETEGSLNLSFRIGEQKMFVVKNLFELCEHVEKSETARYGSKTEINHQIRNFTEEGLKWYQFIQGLVQEELQLEERIDREGGYYQPAASAKGKFTLYGKNLDEFCRLLGTDSVEYEGLEEGKKQKRMIHCLEQNPKVSMTIREADFGDDIFHGIDVSCRMPVFYRGTDAIYFIEGNGLCKAKASVVEPLKLLIDRSDEGFLKFQVGRNNLSDFYYMVLPEFEDAVDIMEENSERIHSYLPPEVRFVFYLDADKDNIYCRVRAQYGDAEESVFDLLKPNSEHSMKRYRMANKESEIIYRISQIFPGKDFERECFHCEEDETQMYEVLEHGAEQLLELGEVRYTQKFRNLFSVRKMKLSLGVSVSSGMLNLDIVTEDMSGDELLDVLKSYRTRKKYYRMKNGDFMSLENDSFEMLEELMHALNLSPKELAKGQIKCPAYRTLYLDKLLKEHSEIYNTRDSYFREMVKNFKTINDADYDVPASLDEIMRGYQKNGYRWMRTLENCHFGGILADDMGLGKTLQAISLLLAAKEEGKKGTSLIVCPASLVFNWGEELKKFAETLKVLLVAGTQGERQQLLEEYDQSDVVVTSYDLLKRDISNYEGKQFLYQIIDEAQYIKNHTTAVAKAVKVIQSEYRFAMTGTPIENRLSELWSIFDYLMPGFFYSYDVFKKELEQPIVKNQDEAAMERLQKMAGTFILRRLKENVLKDLPEKMEETRYVKMNQEQQRLYDAQVVHMRKQLEGQGEEEFKKNKMQIFAELTRLRQICCDPSLCFENYKGDSAKLESCLELVQSAIDGGHKILLFSQFTSMLEIIQERLKNLGIEHYVITGATPKDKRLHMVKAFNQDQTPVFLISLKAGGVGLNLTGADVVIHYDPWWNQAVQNQATDRAHRIGQKNKVVVYKVIMKHSIEEKIQKLQETKKDLADQIVNAQAGQIASMNREELIELLGI